MERVQEGDFSVSDIVVDSENEIGSLTKSFNVMTQRIHELMAQNIREQEAKRKSELKALQSQINFFFPHFLYNTLECINMEILSDRKQTASAMITSLGDFMRIGLNYGNELIPLSRELLHVKSYIDIMNYRFSQKIELISTIPPELTDCLILKIHSAASGRKFHTARIQSG